ncbi:PilZ domain-containing protein [Tsuneonella amylolytica]|uniref:PilZ domain-containing protein n=1 Tax=Tsuneonella amylolytica TaxID=2338327 RepID=UPI000EA90EA6|nr:PilZ domain-containing protein [Tsuneonella amylolytica]
MLATTPQQAAPELRPSLDELVGRRRSTRHPVDISARFLDSEADIRAHIEDISATGACFRLMRPRRLIAGRLSWLGFEIYGEIVWQTEDRCGMHFADRLDAACMRATLDFADRMAREGGDRYHRLAHAWTHGRGDY